MGSKYNNDALKPHLRYNITMSRRTRKPLNLIKNGETPCESPLPASVAAAKEEEDQCVKEKGHVVNDSNNQQKKSLKQLIQNRNSLGEYFRTTEEEKQQQQQQQQKNGNNKLQVVVRQSNGEEEDGPYNGLKLKKMMRNYIQVLSTMMKANNKQKDANWRKRSVVSLRIVKQK